MRLVAGVILFLANSLFTSALAAEEEHFWKFVPKESTAQVSAEQIHTTAIHDLLCGTVRFKPAAVCVGSRYFGSLLLKQPDVATVYYSTGMRLQISQMDKILRNYEYIVGKNYRQFGSADNIIAQSGADQCLSYYDPRSGQDAARAIACGYPWPERFSFVDWIEALAPGLDGGHLFAQVRAIYERYQPARCAMIIQKFDQGNRLSTMLGYALREIPGATQENIDRLSAEIDQVFAQNPDYRDDLNFMLNALDGDCDRFYSLIP
jgi:hypothetical protein